MGLFLIRLYHFLLVLDFTIYGLRLGGVNIIARLRKVPLGFFVRNRTVLVSVGIGKARPHFLPASLDCSKPSGLDR